MRIAHLAMIGHAAYVLAVTQEELVDAHVKYVEARQTSIAELAGWGLA